MHPLDRLLLRADREADSGLTAWRLPEVAPDSVDGAWASRVMLRPSDETLRKIAADFPAFLSASGYPDTPEMRAAWTESAGEWMHGATTVLEPSRVMCHVEWIAYNEDGSDSVNRIEVTTLTADRALVQFDMGLPHCHVPFIAGLVTRENFTGSLALLLSRLDTVLMSLEHLDIEIESDLPRAELVRLACAGARYRVPEVLHAGEPELLHIYQQELAPEV